MKILKTIGKFWRNLRKIWKLFENLEKNFKKGENFENIAKIFSGNFEKAWEEIEKKIEEFLKILKILSKQVKISPTVWENFEGTVRSENFEKIWEILKKVKENLKASWKIVKRLSKNGEYFGTFWENFENNARILTGNFKEICEFWRNLGNI